MKKNIAIIMGGYSKEIEISIQSGNVVAENLDDNKYNIFKVHILNSKWIANINDLEIPINKNDFSLIVDGKKIIFDCVFNAIHGNPGENGAFIAYLDVLGIKHTSAPFYQMALTFNKFDTNCVLRQYGIYTAKSIHLNKNDKIDINYIANEIKLPCFVKANNAGSSFGVTKVYNQENLEKAIHFSFAEDDEVLIESFLDGTEVSITVYNFNNKIEVLPMTEIVSDNDFFDYEAKYFGKSKEITPARITKKEEVLLHNTAVKIYKKLNMKGFTRSDFILVDGKPFFIELNSVPGLSTASILPQQVIASGNTLKEFFGSAIESALR